MVEVEGWKGKWLRQKEDPVIYSWDCELGEYDFDIPKFSISKMLVSNGEFFKFVKDEGYTKP